MSAPYWLQLDEDAIPDDVYGYIRLGDDVFTVPAIPYVVIDDDAIIHFNGPMYSQLYGSLTFTPRGERLTLQRLVRHRFGIVCKPILNCVAFVCMPSCSRSRGVIPDRDTPSKAYPSIAE